MPLYFARATWDEDLITSMPKAVWLNRIRANGLSKQRHAIHGVNSGYGALNLAYLAGYKTIYLLGYDMYQLDDLTHWHGGYEWFGKRNKDYYPAWASEFVYAAAQLHKENIKVYNCNPASAITCFDKSVTYEGL